MAREPRMALGMGITRNDVGRILVSKLFPETARDGEDE